MRFVGYLRQKQELGNLLRIQMDQHQLIIGSEIHFLELSSDTYSYGERSRIQFLWEQNTKYKITIKVQGAWNQCLQRENDCFLMTRICEVVRRPDLLLRINNVRLYLKVSRLSDIVQPNGQWIHDWAFVGPPKACTLTWPKRRCPLEQNWKLWRETIRQVFYGAQGLYPSRLGVSLETVTRGLNNTSLFEDMLAQYPDRYQAILGERKISNAMAEQIQGLMIQGHLYAGSDGSEKEGIGAHAYGFTSGIIEGVVWGGAGKTPGGVQEMASLRAEHAGAIGILLVLFVL